MQQLNLFQQAQDMPLFQVAAETVKPRDMFTEVEEWEAAIKDAREEVGRIVRSGGIATKTKVEDYLMPRWNIDRGCAHNIMNHIGHYNLGWL